MRFDGKGNSWYSFDDLVKELPFDAAQACWEDVVIYRNDACGTPELLDFTSGEIFDDRRPFGSWDEYVDSGIFAHLVRLGNAVMERFSE